MSFKGRLTSVGGAVTSGQTHGYMSPPWLTPVVCSRNPGAHWKRRSHRGGEEDDTEEDLSKDLDDSSTNPTLDETSGTKNGTPPWTHSLPHRHEHHLRSWI